jgi:hypothetical protein
MSNAKVEKCIEVLNEIEQKLAGNRRGVSPRLDDIGVLADTYSELDPSDRKFVFECITEKVGLYLIGFTAALSAKAIDTSEEIWIKRSIILHVMEGFRIDYRENIRNLIFAYYAAEKIGTNFGSLVGAVESLSNEQASIRLAEFCRRDRSLNSLKAFGVREVNNDGITHFQPINYI